jgi:hypothetical protein
MPPAPALSTPPAPPIVAPPAPRPPAPPDADVVVLDALVTELRAPPAPVVVLGPVVLEMALEIAPDAPPTPDSLPEKGSPPHAIATKDSATPRVNQRRLISHTLLGRAIDTIGQKLTYLPNGASCRSGRAA